MRSVLYVTTTFPTIAAFIENEVKRLHARGVRVRVLTLRPVSTEYQPEHADLVPLTQSVGKPYAIENLLALLGWLVRKPHVLIPVTLQMLWASRGSAYALAGHLGYLPAAARIASIAQAEDVERIHGVWAHFPASAAYLASRLTGKRFSMAAHAGSDLYRTQAFLAQKLRAADFVVACVRGNAEMLRRLAPDANVHWLYHGTDLSRFGAIVRARASEPMLLMVGRLAQTKGFDDGLVALGHLRRRGLTPRLVIVGDGPEREHLRHVAQEQGVMPQIEWKGVLDHDALSPLYAQAWALLTPSRVLSNGRRDGIPNVVIEAMAAGLPVVGTHGTGIEEAVVPGETGMLSDPDDPAGFAAALEPLLHDAAKVDAMSAIARGRVGAAFDVEVNFGKLWQLYEASGAKR